MSCAGTQHRPADVLTPPARSYPPGAAHPVAPDETEALCTRPPCGARCVLAPRRVGSPAAELSKASSEVKAINGGEPAYTPDSVAGAPCGASAGGPPSRPAVTRWLLRPTRGSLAGGPPIPLSGLAPGGVYLAARVTPGAGALLPHRCTLACADRAGRPVRPAIGGLFSVALSFGSPRLGVTQHPVLWSPDVPRTGHAGTRPPGRLTTVSHRNRRRPHPECVNPCLTNPGRQSKLDA